MLESNVFPPKKINNAHLSNSRIKHLLSDLSVLSLRRDVCVQCSRVCGGLQIPRHDTQVARHTEGCGPVARLEAVVVVRSEGRGFNGGGRVSGGKEGQRCLGADR